MSTPAYVARSGPGRWTGRCRQVGRSRGYRAADSVDTEKLKEAVDGIDIDMKKAIDSVDKEKAADSVDMEKVKEALGTKPVDQPTKDIN